MKELILNIVTAIILLVGLYIVIFGIGGVFHRAFFEDNNKSNNEKSKN